MLETWFQNRPTVAAEAFETAAPPTNGEMPPPAATQEQLAAWCLAHPAPGMKIQAVPEPGTEAITQSGIHGCLAINWPEAPLELGIAPAEEALFTFDGALADRHPPTAPERDESGNPIPGREGVRLLTWGNPYLQRWLESLARKEK